MTQTTSKSNAVEEQFCKLLDEMDPVVPLDMDQFKVFMGLLTMEEKEINEIYEKGSGMLALIKGRLESLSYKMDPKTQLMLSFICHTPGDAVMYIYYLAYKAKEIKKEFIDFDDFVNIFPMGYFSKSQLDKAWVAQKIGGSNLLDDSDASLSLNEY
tara:strand:- start:982 stop:1449 length:468 start_codon:yes stop_codon:yes gene_type:complete